MTNGPESVGSPRRSRRAADVPVDAGKGPAQRESQQRARDREALRAYKALTESAARPAQDESAAPPTRRQLRLQQQRAAQATAEERRRASGGAGDSAGAEGAPAHDAAAPDAAARPEPGSTDGSRSAAGAPVPPPVPPAAPPAAAPSGGSSAPRAAAPGAAAGSRPAGPAARKDAAPPSRRARRRAEEAAQQQDSDAPDAPAAPAAAAPAPAAGGSDPAGTPEPKSGRKAASTPDARDAGQGGSTADSGADADADPNADVAGMTVEQALAAREALEGQARNQVAMMEAMRREDPYSVDLELLAQQKALAERAAVLNRRTQNIQRLSEQNEQRKPQTSDPTTAHNLAMVTPLEFVKVPGLDRPVMKRPSTAHVPLVTDSQVRVGRGTRGSDADRAPAGRSAGRAAGAGSDADGGRDTEASAEARHARILARADALMNAPLDPDQGARPIGARNAFGLDPLDVMTAGLGRTRRIRWVSFGLAGAGFAALITSILLIVSGFGS